MSVTVADFGVRFTADSATFQRDVDQAKKSLRGYARQAHAANDSTSDFDKTLKTAGKNAMAIGRNVTMAVGMLTAAASAVGTVTVYMVRQNAEQARQLEMMARVADISVERMQAIAYASEQYNISGEKMSDILKDVNDKLGDFAATGGGEFADFFENVAPQVGLTVEKLQKMAGPDALLAIKSAMDEANVPMKQQIFYLESIANDAAALMPLLENNGKKLYELTNRFQDLNVTMSQLDINRLKRMDQEIGDMDKRLTRAFSGLSREIAYTFLPTMRDATGVVEELAAGVSDYGKQISAIGGFQATLNVFSGKGLREHHREVFADIKAIEKDLAEYEGKDYDDLPAINPFGLSQNGWFNLQRDYAMKRDELKAINEKIAEEAKANTADVPMPWEKDKPDPRDSGSYQKIKQLQDAGAKRLALFDKQFSDEQGRLTLAHQERLASIEELQISEQEITRRGFESLAALKAEYREKEKQHFSEQQRALQERQKTKPASAAQQTGRIDVMRQETAELAKEYGRRMILQQNANEQMTLQEDFAYQDRLTKLASNFEAAYEQAEGNQALQKQLENEYFTSRELMWKDHQARLSDIEKTETEKRKEHQKQTAMQLLSFTQQQLSITTSALKDAGRENSAVYKTLFAIQKAAAIPSMIVSTEKAATDALAAFPGPAGVAMAATTRALGYASVGIAGAQAISGMAHDGIDAIPREGTWLLDRGERVYTNDSARKIDQMYTSIMAMVSAMSNMKIPMQKSQGGPVQRSIPAFHFHFKTDSSIDEKDAHQLSQFVTQRVNETLMEAMRPGGALSSQ